MSNKKIVSQILKGNRKWIESEKEMPIEDDHVVIRLCHSTLTTGETDTEIYPLEDIKIGYRHEGTWIIPGPYPKYDYSPLSNRDKLRENVLVTHWSAPEEKEIIWWNTRFDKIRKYELLELKVDPKMEKEMYRALLWGASLITQHAPEELKPLCELLYDLQNCIDFDNKVPECTLFKKQ